MIRLLYIDLFCGAGGTSTGAYGEKETAIRAIYGENTPPPGVASEDIYRFLCDYNVKMNRK